ncbi:MAG: hypothetical protein U0795_11365 [Pirellulales bacterium]
MDTRSQFLNRFRIDFADHGHVVAFGNGEFGMSQLMSQGAIIGDQNQPGTRFVEPSNGKDMVVTANQVDHPGSPAGIAIGRQDADRFMDGQIEPTFGSHQFAVDLHFLALRVDPDSQLGHDLPVDFDPSFSDQLFALTAAGDPGRGQYFLQTLAARFALPGSLPGRIGRLVRIASGSSRPGS